MKVALCDVVGDGSETNPFVPAGVPPDAVAGWIDLRPDPSVAAGFGVAVVPDGAPDARQRPIAVDAGEPLAATSRTSVGNRLGLTLGRDRGPSVAAMLAELLVDHARTDGSRWRPLRAGVDGARRVFLGGAEVWRQEGPRRPHSQSYVETWSGGDGTTLTQAAGRQQNWTQYDASLCEVSSGRLRPNSTAVANQGAALDPSTDTDDLYVEADCAMTARSANIVRIKLEGRRTDGNTLYRAQWDRGATKQRLLIKRNAGQTTLASDTTEPASSFTGRLKCDGSTIQFLQNGTIVFSVTDTGITGVNKGGIGMNTTDTVGDASVGQVTIADFVAAVLTAAQGGYTLSGQVAALLANRHLAATQGAYALTGQAAGLLASRILAAAQGSYALSGQDAALLKVVTMAAAQGGYTLSGQAAALTAAHLLSAVAGSYALTGQAAQLKAQRLLTAAAGLYTLSGQDLGLFLGRRLSGAAGSYTLTGIDVSLRAARYLLAGLGSYVLTGQDVTLSAAMASTPVRILYPSGRGALMAAARASTVTPGGLAALTPERP